MRMHNNKHQLNRWLHTLLKLNTNTVQLIMNKLLYPVYLIYY